VLTITPLKVLQNSPSLKARLTLHLCGLAITLISSFPIYLRALPQTGDA
jgi:hypothetical protein